MKVVFFENIYYDYEFGVVWPIGIVLVASTVAATKP